MITCGFYASSCTWSTSPAPLGNEIMVDYVGWQGASGGTYTFELNPIGVGYHRRPGVYIFTRRALNGNWDGLYIGETGDFEDRLNTGLQNHQAWASVRAHGATHICTLHLPGGLDERLRVETDLRHGLRCPCNLQ